MKIYVKDIYPLIKNVYGLKNSNIEDDQILLTNYCNNNKNDIYIDKEGELFLSLGIGYVELDQYINFVDDKIIYNNQYPYFLHLQSSYVVHTICEFAKPYFELFYHRILELFPVFRHL